MPAGSTTGSSDWTRPKGKVATEFDQQALPAGAAVTDLPHVLPGKRADGPREHETHYWPRWCAGIGHPT